MQTIITETICNSSELPRITIITPSYNQGHFIEETIRSVLLQGYPKLEYIIIDGGSTDNTVEIIKRYEPWITYWVSESDRGQTHAINKGIAQATGEILAYLNSDDYYLPGTLFKVAEYFYEFPQTDLLHGICRYVNQQGEKIGEQFGNIQTLEEILDLWDVWWKKRQFVQPEVFWTRRITEKVGLFQEELNYVMDYEYWCRVFQANSVVGKIDVEFSCFRFTDTQKSNQNKLVAVELLNVVRPLIWDKNLPISSSRRLKLKGNWLYQNLLLNQIQTSVLNQDSRLTRWLKVARTIFYNPYIFHSPNFWTKAKLWVLRN